MHRLRTMLYAPNPRRKAVEQREVLPAVCLHVVVSAGTSLRYTPLTSNLKCDRHLSYMFRVGQAATVE